MLLTQGFGVTAIGELASREFNAHMNAITWIVSRLRDIRGWPSTIGSQPVALPGVFQSAQRTHSTAHL